MVLSTSVVAFIALLAGASLLLPSIVKSSSSSGSSVFSDSSSTTIGSVDLSDIADIGTVADDTIYADLTGGESGGNNGQDDEPNGSVSVVPQGVLSNFVSLASDIIKAKWQLAAFVGVILFKTLRGDYDK